MQVEQTRVAKSTLIAAALGGMGYTMPFFLIALYWVSFYAPPEHAGVPLRIDQAPVLGLSILSLIILVTRVWDMIVDPVIANLSDASLNPKGRRLPFMKRAFILAPLAIAAVFWTPVAGVSAWNILWVLVALIVGVTALSTYTTPFLALLTGQGKDDKSRLSLATAQGLGESMGVILAGQAAFIWTRIETSGVEPMQARQYSFTILAILAVVLLSIPLFLMKLKDIPGGQSETGLTLKQRLQVVRTSPGFVGFLFAFFAFIVSVELVQAGAYFFVNVLLELPEGRLSGLMALMVPSSLIAVPTTNLLSNRFSRRSLVLANFIGLALLLLGASQLGRYPVSANIQAIVLFVLAGIPLGSMTVLAMAVVMDSAALSGSSRSEGVFVAARNIAYKSGVTLGAALFASLVLLGKDRGDDLGLRVTCFIGAGLCILACIVGYRALGKMLKTDNSSLVTTN